MKKILKLAVAATVASACASVSAGSMTVTFEPFLPGIYSNGEQLIDGAEQITVRGEGGFDGALVNGRDPSSCFVAVCPVGNETNYYAALNDGGFSFSLGGGAFGLSSIDFGFILPVDSPLGFSVGKLIVMTDTGVTASQDFALQDALGNFGFARWNFGTAFTQGAFGEVTFNACLYDGSGACVNPAGNQAQFAVDNLTYIPEPGTLPLLGLSLAGMLAAYRRRKSA